MDQQSGKHLGNKFNNVEEIPLNIYNSTTQRVKNMREPTCKENLSNYFSEYCGATSIHGIQYIGERGRFIIEKIVWIIITTVIWSICLTLIVKSYYKWQDAPIIVTLATTETPIWEIPFPAITICPEVKFNPADFNYTDVLMRKLNLTQFTNITPLEEEYFETASLICNKESVPNFSDIANEDDAVEDDIIYNIYELFNSTRNGVFVTVEWDGKETLDTTANYSLTLTEEGFCFSFNMIKINSIFKTPSFYKDLINENLEVKHWSLEAGYAKEAGNDAYPKRTFVSGLKGGVKFTFVVKNSYLDYLCGYNLQGFKIVLHHPANFPDLNKHIRLPLDSIVQVGIKPNMVTVAKQLKNYSPQVRKCYFIEQKSLMFFNNYTQDNCMLECLANYTLNHCKCVPFYMPKNSNIPTCGLGKLACVEQSKVNISMKSALDHCDCLPSCSSIDYDVEISQSTWNWREFFLRVPKKYDASIFDFEKDHIQSLWIYYKGSHFISSERNELHGYLTFFSDIGGLLGLFMGFSVTSGLEILYFLTLRLGCNINKYGKRFWSGNTELLNAKENTE